MNISFVSGTNFSRHANWVLSSYDSPFLDNFSASKDPNPPAAPVSTTISPDKSFGGT